MARYTIYGKNGTAKYTGRPVYHGAYLKVGYLEFREISSPAPIEWEVGDYVEYDRTGLRYTLYTIPQQSVTKQARRSSYGAAFVYHNVQFFEPMRIVELAPFRDLVPDVELNIHFSTQSVIAAYDDVYGIAERIQVCLNAYAQDYASNSGAAFVGWLVEVVDASSDEGLSETLHRELDYSVSGVSCLGALEKIYELWNNIGWVYSFRGGRHVITIGGSDVRTSANTLPDLTYGKDNGLRNLESSLTNRADMATRLFVYGSTKNMVSRWYNNLPYSIRDKDSIDIQHLMLPVLPVASLGWDGWGRTAGQYDAAKAYLENPSAIAKYGLIEKTVYLDGSEEGEIYPSIKGATIGMVRTALGSPSAKYYPKTSVYTDPSLRVDQLSSCVNPGDSGSISSGGTKYTYQMSVPTSRVEQSFSPSTGDAYTTRILSTDMLSGMVGDVDMMMGMVGTLRSSGFSIYATVAVELYHGSYVDTVYLDPISMGTTSEGCLYRFIIPDLSFKTQPGEVGTVAVNLTISDVRSSGGEEVWMSLEPGLAEVGIVASMMQTFTMRIPQVGFNINDRMSLGNGKATLGITGGMCAGRNFLVRACTYDSAADEWVLECYRQKDSSVGMWYPNSNYPILPGDSYILLDIALPDIYVSMAELRLLDEGRKLLDKLSRPAPLFTPSIDPIVARRMQDALGTELTKIREGRYFHVLDEDVELFGVDYILIDTVTISEDDENIPTYKITLREGKKITIKETDSSTNSDKSTSVMSIPGGTPSGEGIPDAPINGKKYGRKDGMWVEISDGGGGNISGEHVTGETSTPAFPFVEYVEQTLTDTQKARARSNIGALGSDDLSDMEKEIEDLKGGFNETSSVYNAPASSSYTVHASTYFMYQPIEAAMVGKTATAVRISLPATGNGPMQWELCTLNNHDTPAYNVSRNAVASGSFAINSYTAGDVAEIVLGTPVEIPEGAYLYLRAYGVEANPKVIPTCPSPGNKVYRCYSADPMGDDGWRIPTIYNDTALMFAVVYDAYVAKGVGSIGKLDMDARESEVALQYKGIAGEDKESLIPKATTTSAGVMSAKDKAALDELNGGVVTGTPVSDAFKAEVEDTVEKVKALSSAASLSLLILTDPHERVTNAQYVRRMNATFNNLKAVAKGVKVDGAMSLGDIFWATGTEESGEGPYHYVDQDVCNDHFRSYSERFSKVHENIYMLIGNHDGIRASFSGYPTTAMYPYMQKYMEGYTERNGDSLYFWFDRPDVKTRCVCLASPDQDDLYRWMSTDQLRWLAHTALDVEDGWNVLVFCHTRPDVGDIILKDTLFGIVNAFGRHEAYHDNYIDVDYTGYESVKMVAWICGHQHYDRVQRRDDFVCPIIYIASPNPAANATGTLPEGASNPPKSYTEGVLGADCWDAVIFRPDEGKIHLVRFGAGDDREVTVDANAVEYDAERLSLHEINARLNDLYDDYLNASNLI